MIETGKTFLMVKISTPSEISFYDEHQHIINQQGYVWFCRFGKCNLVSTSITQDGNYLFIKESTKNGGKRYIAHFSEISNSNPDAGFPEYYNEVDRKASLWFKITSIKELDDDFESHFKVASSGNSLEGVYLSMCNSFYIRCIKPYGE